MGEIMVLAEHRQGEVRDITFEMLFKARELCQQNSHSLTAVLMTDGQGSYADQLKSWANEVVVFKDDRLGNFNADFYNVILAALIEERKPFIVLMGHTPWGMDLAPALSVKTGYPLVTDCVDVLVEDGKPKVIRQIYSGKIYSKVSFKESDVYLVTVRPSSFTPEVAEPFSGEIVEHDLPADLPTPRRVFKEFVDTAAGEVDISQAPFLISVGRGIGEQENIEQVKELAEKMGAVLSCSRPVVDENWLPKYHQVGTSGKSVKPKIYLALGISGAFQHVAGIAGAGTVIAINKDKKAPIFRVADYGVVDDLFKVVAALKEKIES